MRPPVLLGITLALVATLLAVLLLAGRGIDPAAESPQDRLPDSPPAPAEQAAGDGMGAPPPLAEEDEEDRDDRGFPRAGEDDSAAQRESRGPDRAAATPFPMEAPGVTRPPAHQQDHEDDERPRGPSGPPVDAPRELVEELAEERQALVAAIVDELMEELQGCTAQSRMPETFLRQAMLRVRVEENSDGFGARISGLMGAQVEPEVEACYQRALDASPFPPPDAVLDAMEDGVRGYEVWVGAQLQ